MIDPQSAWQAATVHVRDGTIFPVFIIGLKYILSLTTISALHYCWMFRQRRPLSRASAAHVADSIVALEEDTMTISRQTSDIQVMPIHPKFMATSRT